jgi:hypothetical protein
MLAEDKYCKIDFNGKTYDSRHGGPFDRGSADSWYSRGIRPHYFLGGTYDSIEVSERDMTAEQIAAYHAGYAYNEQFGGKKEWD